MSQIVKLIPGTLPGGTGYCFTDFQQLNVDIVSQMSGQLQGGAAFYNLGEDEPDPDLRSFPWFKPSTGQWWSYNFGAWVRPNPEEASSDARRIFIGDLTALQTYDGGDTMALGDASGPMWEQDTDFDDRIPIGVKTIIAAVLGTAGSGSDLVLQASNLPNHNHYLGLDGVGVTVDSKVGHLRVGAGTDVDYLFTAGDTTTQAAVTRNHGNNFGASDDTVQPTGISILNPVIGVYFIKRTPRGWYKM